MRSSPRLRRLPRRSPRRRNRTRPQRLPEQEFPMAVAQVAAATQPQAKYERLIARAKQAATPTTIVAHPCDETSLRGVVEAAETGLIVPILVGPAARIATVARQHGLDIGDFEL